MKKIVYSILLLTSICIKSQQIVNLSGTKNINTGSYLKDLDNVLPLFVGEWTANYENNQVILNIEKIEKYPLKIENVNYYSDILFLRYVIKDSQNKEIFSNLQKNITDTGILKSSSASFDNKTVSFEYTGEECHVDQGYITLIYKGSKHLIWEYISDDIQIDKTKCPNVDNIRSYIPKTYELIFTKK